MGFPSLQIKKIYDTSTDNFVEDFFSPILSVAKNYDRGVGFFSSGWLKMNSGGMKTFAENGGHARWVTSPILSKLDWDTMCLGTEAKQNELLFTLLSSAVTNLQESLETDVLSALAWLIADDVIEFKLAVPRNQLTGEFHDKFGIFSDSDGNSISFSGSYNDSIQGLLNYESITTFLSWDESSSDVVDLEQTRFNRLWDNEDPNVKVFDLPEAIKYEIVKCRSLGRPYSTLGKKKKDWNLDSPKPIVPRIPKDLMIREYQNQAYEAWVANHCQGFFEMATGTGKTITSLYSAIKTFEVEGKLALIIAAPYIHLVDQWDQIAQKFGFIPILAYGSSKTWKDKLANKIMAFNQGSTRSMCVITTHTTFNSKSFNAIIENISTGSMIIADEAHHFGSEKSKVFLTKKIEKRLALSATPNRWFDDIGTRNLLDYFGPTVFNFPLERAISEGYLTRYYYFPIPIELTDEEVFSYTEISKKIAPLFFKKNKTEKEEKTLQSLLIKRSDILKNAENKLIAFDQEIESNPKIHHCICYCSPNQKNLVLKILGIKHQIPTHQFTYEEGSTLRQEVINRFDLGELKAIVAIKCLDEGVDIPSSQTAFFLSNSTNPREFIQRRGRVLRKYENKDYAFLYDFLAIPPLSVEPEIQEINRSILKKELRRFELFANSCQNKHNAYEAIWKIANKFGVLDF